MGPARDGVRRGGRGPAAVGHHRGDGRGRPEARLDAGCWYDVTRNPGKRGALLHSLESGRYLEFMAVDQGGADRGLIMGEVIGT